jgi:hypothetical protein
VIGAKTITTVLLASVGAVAAWLFLSPARLAGLDAVTLFWVGLWASAAGPLVVHFWGMHRRSRHGFVYSHADEFWEDEADFLHIGPHRIVIVESEGEAFDLPPVVQYATIITLAFLVGLLTIDTRGLAIVANLPEQLTRAGSDFCPDPNEQVEVEENESPGCALIRRAFELGYAEDLGPCEPEESEKETGVCTLRHHDEPLLHYGWRLLEQFWTDASARAEQDYLAELRETFIDRADELDDLVAAQGHLMGTGPRASHHIWTNLPRPGSWLSDQLPSDCVERFRAMPHRPHLDGVTAPASVVLEHVLGKLLFEPRYHSPAGFCREYTIHWDAALDICDRLAADPEAALRDSGALGNVQEVVERHALAHGPRTGAPTSARPEESRTARPVQRYASFTCFLEEAGATGKRESRTMELGGHRFEVAEMRVAPLERPMSGHIQRYGQLAALLTRGFHYGGMMSEASVLLESTESYEPLFKGNDFALARLEYLADLDIFLGHDWILERADLRDLYPYHLHLKNFVELFRRRYRVERGRL